MPVIRKLTPRELQTAIEANPKEFPNEMPCANCGHRWMQHMGKLCPATPGGFMIIDGEMVPIMPVFQETKTFIPDVDYFKTPNFDVV